VWSIVRAFRHIAKEGFRANIINVHVYDAGGPALAIAKLQGIPIVVSEHFSSFPRKLLGPLDVCKAWLAFRWADAVLPVSHALQKAIEDYGIHARFQVIPNVADTSLFWSPPDRKRTNHRCILFVGQLTPVKGVPDLLYALSRLGQRRDDWHVDIVGDGIARGEYERLAVDLKLCEKVVFHGLRSKREVAEFMRRADLFVLPSLCETFSAPAVEALATGIPVLATRCGGPEEFITEEVGYLVARNDPEAFFKGLDYMLDHLHRYSPERISQYAAERFSPQVVGGKLHAIYEFLLAGGRLGSVSP
jgi:glycosyltransferase involved in cell wall biosynthesis